MSARGICVFIAIVVLAALFLAPAPADAKKVKEWVVTELPSLKGWEGSIGNDVSDSGHIGGVWVDADGGMHAARWYKGKAHDVEGDLGLPDDMDYSGVMSVNSNGRMVGNAWNDDGGGVAVLWDSKKGKMVDLHPGDSYVGSSAYGINASGCTVGFVVTEYSNPYPGAAWIWPKGDTTGEALPLGDYDTAMASGVSSSGAISGTAYDIYGRPFAVAWIKGRKGEYELFDVHAEMVEEEETISLSMTWDIGEDGTVIGYALLTDGSVAPFRWSAAVGVELLDTDGEARGIPWKKKAKYIAGGIGGNGLISDDAAVWVKGELEVLPDLDDFPNMESSSINGSGLVVGYSLDETYTNYQGWYAEKK